LGSDRKKVCKSAFLKIYGVTERRVRTIRENLVKGLTPNDKRGKSKSKNAIQPSELKLINDHISSFPVKQSHYSSEKLFYYFI